jgi:hypothetical protein
MREFVEGRLPPGITTYLPQEARKWHSTSANDIAKRGLVRVAGRAGRGAGLVIHYDIMRPFSKGFQSYSKDPILTALTAVSAKMTVATVLPSRERLVQQYVSRSTRDDQYEEWWTGMLRLKRWRRRLHKRLSALFGKRQEPLKPGQLQVLQLYETTGGLDEWLERWHAFLEGLRRDHDVACLLYVTPAPAANGHPTFHLTRLA